jgi:hypothetical protein
MVLVETIHIVIVQENVRKMENEAGYEPHFCFSSKTNCNGQQSSCE